MTFLNAPTEQWIKKWFQMLLVERKHINFVYVQHIVGRICFTTMLSHTTLNNRTMDKTEVLNTFLPIIERKHIHFCVCLV